MSSEVSMSDLPSAAATQQQVLTAVEGIVSDHDESVWSISWHPKYSNLLATCSSDKTVRLYYVKVSPSTGRLFAKCIDVLENQHNRTIRRVDWSLPSGNALACASFDGTSSIWILLQNKLENHLQALEEESQNSESTVSSLTNLGLLKCVSTLEGHENEVKSVAWNYKPISSDSMDQTDDGEEGDCGLLATCGRDKTVWVWEAIDKVGFSDFDCNSVCSGHTQDVKFVAWHPLTRPNMPSLLYSASYDNTIRIWKEGGFEEDYDRQSDEWKCVGILRGHTSTVWALAFEPQLSSDADPEYPQFMVSVGDDKSLILYREDVVGNYIDMNVTQVQTISNVHTRTIYYVDWCVYNHPVTGELVSLVATTGGDNLIGIYQFDRTERQLKLLTKIANAHDSDINCCVWNKNEFGLLSSCSDDGAVKFWKLKM